LGCYHIFEQNQRGKWYNKIKNGRRNMVRKYSKQLKASVINEIINKHRSTSKVAAELNIPLKTVEKWITLYNKDNTIFDVVELPLTEQVDVLKKEVERLRKDNDILKKTIILLAKKE
jgi:transposase-like protein